MIVQEFIFLFVLGFLGNLIGTLAGGAGLITIPAMMLSGFPVHLSIGVNKFASVVACLANVLQIIRGKLISEKTLISAAVFGIIGGIVGGIIASNMEEQTLNVVVIILLFFALVLTIVRKPTELKDNRGLQHSSPLIQKVLTYMIAVYDGFFGPGAATLAIIAFLQRGYRYIEAVHLTRIILLGSNAGAMIIFWESGFINWNYAIPLALGSIVGARVGFRVLPKISQEAARIVLMIISILLIIQILFKMII